MKKLFLLLIFLFAVLAGEGCSEQAPAEDVLHEFYLAANEGEYEKAEKMLSKDVFQSYDTWGFSVKSGMDDITRNGTIKELVIQEVQEEKEKAIVKFQITFTDEESKQATVTMWKEGGEWKVGLRD